MDPHTQAAARLGTQVAGKYRLDRVLGVGGMGAVYEALHLYTERRVAVKLLHATFLEGGSVTARRFMLEAKAAAAIQHPSVVEVLDAGEADGVPYVVFELLTGETLSAALAGGHLDQGDLLELIAQVLEMLELAHGRGIVHRDLKPENLFVCRDASGALRAKVLDFGIARRLDRPLGEPLTQQGAVLGTPFYMSPEQMLGEPVDARSDLWAVGAVLFRALSGHIPFEARNYSALLAEVLQKGAPPLSRHRPDLPVELRAAVDRALARDPEVRWASAAELRAAIAPFMRARSAGAASVREVPVAAFPAALADTAPPAEPPISAFATAVIPPAPRPSYEPRPRVPGAPDLAARGPAAWERALGEIEGEIDALRARGSEPLRAPTGRAPVQRPAVDPDGGAWLKRLFTPKKAPP